MRNSGDILVKKSEENRPHKKHRHLKVYFQETDEIGSDGKLFDKHANKPSNSKISDELPNIRSDYKLLRNDFAPLF